MIAMRNPTFESEHLVPQVNAGFNADLLGEMPDSEHVTSFVRRHFHPHSVHPARCQQADNNNIAPRYFMIAVNGQVLCGLPNS